jgi:hypothetical protein
VTTPAGVTLASLRAAATAAVTDHRRVVKLVGGENYAHLPAHQRSNLVGVAPRWAHYVLGLGDAGPNMLVSGSPQELRSRALRMLLLADAIEPIILPKDW